MFSNIFIPKISTIISIINLQRGSVDKKKINKKIRSEGRLNQFINREGFVNWPRGGRALIDGSQYGIWCRAPTKMDEGGGRVIAQLRISIVAPTEEWGRESGA